MKGQSTAVDDKTAVATTNLSVVSNNFSDHLVSINSSPPQDLAIEHAVQKLLQYVQSAILHDDFVVEIFEKNGKMGEKGGRLKQHPRLLTQVSTQHSTLRLFALVCLIASIVVAVAGAIVIIVVVVTMRDNDGALLPTRMPSADPSCIYCIQRAPSDFSLNGNESIWQLVENAANHSILAQLLAVTATDQYLDNVTLFAPSDEAFSALPAPYAYYLSNYYWKYHLVTMLSDHIVREPLTSAQIFRVAQLPTVSGSNLDVNDTDHTLGDDAKILLDDIPATNGYVQVPDRVILRDDLRRTLLDSVNRLQKVSSSNFTIFGRLLNSSGVEDLLLSYLPNGMTLLMPTDSAFAALDPLYFSRLNNDPNLKRIFILYNLIPMNIYKNIIVSVVEQINSLSLSGFTVWFSATNPKSPSVAYANTVPIQKSVYAENGLIHVLDQVILPPTVGDLLEITTNVTSSPSYDFHTFTGLSSGPAQLVSLFFGSNLSTTSGPLTVFAPLQVAFDRVNETSQQVFGMLQEPSHWWFHVKSLILHHCVAQDIHNADLVVGTVSLPMLSGYNISLQVVSEGNMTNDDLGHFNMLVENYNTYPNVILDGRANLTLNNVVAVNGMVYGINRLLLPPWASVSLYETVVRRTELSVLVSLMKAANLTGFLTDMHGITLLAPNDAAFSSVDATNITLVRDLVLRHILTRNVYTTDLLVNKSAPSVKVFSLNHHSYQAEHVDKKYFVGGAQIVVADVLSSNGVVQVIDRVLR